MPWPSEVELSKHVRDLTPHQMRTLVPPPIAVRADQLIADLMDRVRILGDVTHGELIAALIQTTNTDEAGERIKAYRHARVHETLMDAKKKRGSHPLPPKTTGRPRKHST